MWLWAGLRRSASCACFFSSCCISWRRGHQPLPPGARSAARCSVRANQMYERVRAATGAKPNNSNRIGEREGGGCARKNVVGRVATQAGRHGHTANHHKKHCRWPQTRGGAVLHHVHATPAPRSSFPSHASARGAFVRVAQGPRAPQSRGGQSPSGTQTRLLNTWTHKLLLATAPALLLIIMHLCLIWRKRTARPPPRTHLPGPAHPTLSAPGCRTHAPERAPQNSTT